MPTSEFKELTISYTCPECEKRVDRAIPFVSGDKGKVPLTAAWWCTYRYCGARHHIEYAVRDKGCDKPDLKVEKFCSEEQVHKKRFQVLEWSGMESET